MAQAPHHIAILPGHLCNARLFTNQVDSLGSIGNVHFVDLYHDDSVAEMASHALAQLPAHFTLIANSMGGAVAFEVLRRQPERVLNLILIGTTCRDEITAQSERRSQAIVLVEQENWGGLAQLYAPVFFHPANRENDQSLEARLHQMIIDASQDGIRRQQRAFSSRPDSRNTLAHIRCPTLVICGREDTITPLALSQEIAAGIANCGLVIVERSGHVPMLEQPAQTNAVLFPWLNEKLRADGQDVPT